MWAFVLGLVLFQSQSALERGLDLYRHHEFDLAVPALAEAVRADPSNIQARVWLARALIEAGRTPEALRQIRQLLERYPDNPEAMFESGRIFQDLAGAKFAQMERLAPASPETHEMLGRYYEAQNRLDEALAQYRSALKIKPDRPGLHFLIGNVLWKQRDYEAAAPELTAELRTNPHHTMANHRMGNILIASDESSQAIAYLEKAVAADAGFLEARRDLGKAYRMAGRLDDALRELRFVAEKRPDDESVHAQLAIVYRGLGNQKQAAAEMSIQREILRKRSQQAQHKLP